MRVQIQIKPKEVVFVDPVPVVPDSPKPIMHPSKSQPILLPRKSVFTKLYPSQATPLFPVRKKSDAQFANAGTDNYTKYRIR